MAQEIETEGKTVTIAVEQGLRELNLRRDEVEVTVIEEGNAGFLGMGSKPARVRIRRKRWEHGSAPDGGKSEAAKEAAKLKSVKQAPKADAPRSSDKADEILAQVKDAKRIDKREPKHAPAVRKPAPRTRAAVTEPVDPEKACAEAKSVLEEILKLAGVSYESVACEWDKAQERVHAEIDSEDGALLIGKGGRTLESIQFLVTVIVGRRLGIPTAIQVETEGYWERVEGKVLAEAARAAEQVKKEGGSYRFEPMEPSLRRLIHRTLADNPDVVTISEGEGSLRKVVVKASGDSGKR